MTISQNELALAELINIDMTGEYLYNTFKDGGISEDLFNQADCRLTVKRLELCEEYDDIELPHNYKVIKKSVNDIVNDVYDFDYWCLDDECNNPGDEGPAFKIFMQQCKRVRDNIKLLKTDEPICIRKDERYNANDGAYDVYTFINHVSKEIT